MIITIAGRPGAGKSTVGKILSEKLGYNRYSIGDLRGKAAQDRDMTIDEWNKLGEASDETDIAVDNYQKKLGDTQDDFIIDGRISWHFIPNSLKVFLDVNAETGASRIFEHSKEGERKDEGGYESVEDVKSRAEARNTSDNIRYQKYYDISWDNKANFDLVIDTTNLTPDEVATQIIDKMNEKV